MPEDEENSINRANFGAGRRPLWQSLLPSYQNVTAARGESTRRAAADHQITDGRLLFAVSITVTIPIITVAVSVSVAMTAAGTATVSVAIPIAAAISTAVSASIAIAEAESVTKASAGALIERIAKSVAFAVVAFATLQSVTGLSGIAGGNLAFNRIVAAFQQAFRPLVDVNLCNADGLHQFRGTRLLPKALFGTRSLLNLGRRRYAQLDLAALRGGNAGRLVRMDHNLVLRAEIGDLNQAFGDMNRTTLVMDRHRELRSFDHSNQIRGAYFEMSLSLLPHLEHHRAGLLIEAGNHATSTRLHFQDAVRRHRDPFFVPRKDQLTGPPGAQALTDRNHVSGRQLAPIRTRLLNEYVARNMSGFPRRRSEPRGQQRWRHWNAHCF